ncbi:MAG: hypothetical protein JW763_07415 [candidate division Zixibacteria bacterium]|nr:hypothetical protein [candidate division Zixibacteria bacterium]
MVELTSRRIGGDITGNRIRFASRMRSSGMNVIDAVGDFAINGDSPEILANESELYFAVPEADAVIKRVGLPADRTLDLRQAALFALSVSLIDDISKYYLEAYDLNGNEEKLAVAYNRHCVDQRISELTERVCKPTGFKLKSLSLADGYRQYCRSVGGDLICLLDLSPAVCSYCFLYHDRPISLGAVTCSKSNTDTMSVIDITATLKFQQAVLFSSGKSAPLSRILITGPSADGTLVEKIASMMKITTEYPSMKPSAFAPGMAAKAESYLVSLGLTVSG